MFVPAADNVKTFRDISGEIRNMTGLGSKLMQLSSISPCTHYRTPHKPGQHFHISKEKRSCSQPSRKSERRPLLSAQFIKNLYFPLILHWRI